MGLGHPPHQGEAEPAPLASGPPEEGLPFLHGDARTVVFHGKDGPRGEADDHPPSGVAQGVFRQVAHQGLEEVGVSPVGQGRGEVQLQGLPLLGKVLQGLEDHPHPGPGAPA